jgi:hypothetical protein
MLCQLRLALEFTSNGSYRNLVTSTCPQRSQVPVDLPIRIITRTQQIKARWTSKIVVIRISINNGVPRRDRARNRGSATSIYPNLPARAVEGNILATATHHSLACRAGSCGSTTCLPCPGLAIMKPMGS